MKPATMKGLAIILFVIYFPPIVENKTCSECNSVYLFGESSCKTVKEFITCLESTLETCSYVMMTSYSNTIEDQLHKLKPVCIKDDFSTCNCENKAIEGYNLDDNECSIGLKAITCLRNTTDAGCAGTRAVAAAAYEERIKSKCSGGATTTCTCEIAHAKADVETAADQCTAATSTKKCLEKITSTTVFGCDQSSKAADIITNFAQPLIDENCKTKEVCDCETAYNTTTSTDIGKACTAANIAKECLENITSTTAVGCDGSSKAADVITNVVQPLIDKHCGAASLNGVDLTVGILVMLLEMTRWI